MLKANFCGYDCEVIKGKYENGNTALQLIDIESGESVAVATVNLGEKLPYNMTYIKNYSENEGMLKMLTDIGLIEEINDYTTSGYVSVPLVTLNTEILNFIN